MDYDVKRIADNARIYHGAQSMFAQFGSALYDVVFVWVGDGVVLQGVEGSLFPVSVLFSECLFYKPLSLQHSHSSTLKPQQTPSQMMNINIVRLTGSFTGNKGMLKCLAGGQALVRVPSQQLPNEVHEVGIRRSQLPLQRQVRRVDVPHLLLLQEDVEVVVALVHLQPRHAQQTVRNRLQQRRGGGEQVPDGGVVEQQLVRVQLRRDAPQRPHVHALVAVRAQNDFGSAVGAALDVEGARGQRLEAADEVAAAEVHQLDLRATA